ncbi:efflux RND transporter periplasmic adaptor subunit [Terriglobus aquaticus]|uniref:Efflux RND transporter periplasmic adaptor subunit n=1 Tax=Terriglobus aquaticus TaxID=940139 RepID=A0ABW9KLJ2_9BACT|nr:efflux RND transporter periplasmic adaptor subunit [Terriglobus aquaticus]
MPDFEDYALTRPESGNAPLSSHERTPAMNEGANANDIRPGGTVPSETEQQRAAVAAEGAPQAGEHEPVASTHAEGPTVTIDPNRKLGRGAFVALAVAGVALVVVIALGLLSRVRAASSLKTETRENAIETVSVTHPTLGARSQELRLPANTEAFIDTPIYSRTDGYLQKWFADIGATVHKGQLLAVVQTPEVDQQVEQAQAQVSTARANEQIAEVTAKRWQDLLAKNAVSRQETDQALSDKNARQATLEAAEANLRRLQQMQGFERIYAPFDGIVTARNVDIGSLIQAGDSNTPHSELFHMASVNRLRVFVPVPEVYTQDVHDGGSVTVTSDALPGEQFQGTIARNATSIDPATRTLRVEVDLDNPGRRLLPGAYTFVHLPVPAMNASLTLPSNALLFRSEGLRVGVVQSGHVHLQPIRIGHDYGATVEVTAGLHPSDSVILNPSDSLAEGQPVKVSAAAAADTQGGAR